VPLLVNFNRLETWYKYNTQASYFGKPCYKQYKYGVEQVLSVSVSTKTIFFWWMESLCLMKWKVST